MNITFKKLFSSAAICAALAMSNAHAANDVTLKVIGNIVPRFLRTLTAKRWSGRLWHNASFYHQSNWHGEYTGSVGG